MMQAGVHPRRVRTRATIAPEERSSAAVVSLVLYALAGVALAVTAHMSWPARRHEVVLLALAGLVVAAAPVAYLIQRDKRAPAGLLHLLQCFALVLVAVVVACSGGADSPYWFYIFFPALFCSYFYRRPVAAAYLFACVVVHALPLVYDHGASDGLYLTQLVSAAPAYVALGLAISSGKRAITALRGRAETLAREQGALRRVATAVVDGRPAQDIYAMVASELATLLGCEGAGILRCQDDTMEVVGAYGEHDGAIYREGTTLPLVPASDAHRAVHTGSTVRVDRHGAGAPITRAGYLATVLAPVTVGGRVWGLLATASTRPAAFDAEDEQTLLEFGALLATAISSAEERARLAEQALTDPLTNLANSRAVHGRLHAEVARASRYGSPLSVAVIDVDHFKDVNDNAGHETGDEMLVRVAAALASFARTEDTLGRLGGDEFAWILPDTTREQALVAVERARRMIASAPADPYRITISAGICDTDSVEDPTQLLHLADSALYWSKAHGRNQCWVYDPTVVQQLTEMERAQRLERAQAIEGLRGLARSIDNRQSATHDHSERVAVLATKLARGVGYRPEDVLRVGEAARLHELGRLTVSAVAPVDGNPLGPAALARLREEATLSAQMVAGVLDPQQVGWIAGQYEARERRPEARAGGDELLALADAWDTLTAVTPGLPEDALTALEGLVGEYFGACAFSALTELHHSGDQGPSGTSGEAVGDSG
jgi:diguanylate cyclase (GGDEF)-like protein